MNEGLLWYEPEKEFELEKSIEKAIDYFVYKYGRNPLACYVHPDAITSEFVSRKEIKVMSDEKIIKNHIWLEFS